MDSSLIHVQQLIPFQILEGVDLLHYGVGIEVACDLLLIGVKYGNATNRYVQQRFQFLLRDQLWRLREFLFRQFQEVDKEVTAFHHEETFDRTQTAQ